MQGNEKHVSLNVYANEIVVYDEIKKKRIATYLKTSLLSVCQLDTDGGTTECAILLTTNSELIITAKNKSGRCVSLNFYSNEIVFYDEVAKKRICVYAKTG